jgi:hypothetical protein
MEDRKNGAAAAAFLAAGIGAFAIGLFVILDAAGIYSAPAIYGPAGGASGRTGFAIVVWAIAWPLLHFRWKDRQVEASRVYAVAAVLVALGILGTFPPVWRLFG